MYEVGDLNTSFRDINISPKITITVVGLLFSFQITEIIYTENTRDCSMCSSTYQTALLFPVTKQYVEQIDRNSTTILDSFHGADIVLKDHRTVKTEKLVKRIFNDYVLPEANCSKKLLVYRCSYQTRCFGFGDRVRGMISTFLLALLTDRTFCIEHSKPCLLSQFFTPNLYNWSKCLSMYNTTTDIQYVHFMAGTGNLPNLSAISTGDIWDNKTVVMTTNLFSIPRLLLNPRIRNVLPWLTTTNDWMIRHTLYHILFKLENSFQLHVDSLIDMMTLNASRSLVGVHIRKVYFNINDTKYIFQFLEQFTNNSRYVIYIATDIPKIKLEATERFANVHTLNTSGLHVSLHVESPSATCESLRLALLEQQILARSNILIKTPSSFSQQAEMIRGEKGITYEFTGTSQNSKITFRKYNLFHNINILSVNH